MDLVTLVFVGVNCLDWCKTDFGDFTTFRGFLVSVWVLVLVV